MSIEKEKLFATHFTDKGLRSQAVRGGFYTVASQASKLILQTGATAVLARILLPEDFGLIAMVIAISNFVLIFKDLGLSSATIQREKITHSLVNCMFWINVGFSVFLCLIFLALSPLFAKLYSEPKIISITMLIAVTFVIEGLGSQHLSLLKRQMLFKSVVIIDVLSVFGGIIVALTMAIFDFGYWALVGQILSQVIFSTLLIWIASPWRPSRPNMDAEIALMLGFGGSVTIFNSLIYAVRNLDNIFIGTFLGATSLGFYSKAYNLLMLPIRQVSNPLASVAIPALSKLQNDSVRYKSFFLNLCSVSSFVSVPLVGYSFVDADVIVRILLGDKWLPAIEIFRWLAPAALVGAVNFIPSVLCVSRGKPEIQLKWAIRTSPLVILGFWLGLKWGVNGVAASFTITYPVTFIIFLKMSCKNSPVTMRDVLKAVSMPLIAGIISSGMLTIFKMTFISPGINLYARPLLHLTIYMICFIGILLLFENGRQDIRRVIKLRQLI